MADQIPTRDFDKTGPTGPPSCKFKLGGQEWTCRPRDDVPFGTIAQLFGSYLSGNEAQAIVAVGPFFSSVLIPAQVDAFMEMLGRTEKTLKIGQLEPLMQYVAENVLGRPTRPAKNSAGGSKSTGRSSKAGSSSRATTRTRSA